MQLRQRFDNFILLSSLGIILGILYSFAEHTLKGTELVPLIFRAVACLVLTFLSVSVVAKALRSWFKGRTFFFNVFWRTLLYAFLIIFWLTVINGISEALMGNGSFFDEAIGYLRYSDMLWYNLLTVFTIVLIYNTILEINTLHRKGELFKYIAGLYVTPKEVERIFMFADIKSSTSIAEKLGNIEFGNLLQDVFSDISEAINRSKGEIYGYVGDEVIISWKYKHAAGDSHCIRCFFDMQRSLAGRKDHYLNRYHELPQIKAGMHAGKVVVMWVGEEKKEIVYLGDVLNTTSRIQAECNRLGESLLVSGQVIAQLPSLGSYTARPLGEIELRGKTEKISLFGVTGM